MRHFKKVNLKAKKNQRIIVQHLRDLANAERAPEDLECGICDEMRVFYGRDFSNRLITLMREWPEFINEHGQYRFGYIVPAKNSTAHHAYESPLKKWGNREYGQARRRLCAWLADQLEEFIEHGEKMQSRSKP
jgi:hypothetical protein